MDQATRLRVRQRAGNRCEYCRISQNDEPIYSYQIEHITAKKHGGSEDDANLALACPFCNQHKGTDLTGLDPLDNAITPLFHPRLHVWEEHFRLIGPEIVGLTAIGRTTVQTLRMNDLLRVELRRDIGAG